jgi:hypothetical protein
VSPHPGPGHYLPQKVYLPSFARWQSPHLVGTGDTVLGSYPGYIAKAESRGASYFDIGSAWNPETGPVANRYFINLIADRGDRVLLSIPKTQIQAGTGLAEEVRILVQERGYKWIGQWALGPGG